MHSRTKMAAVLAVWLLGSLVARGQAADQRIVFVNMDRAFNEYYKTQLAQEQLNEQAREFTEEGQRMAADFEALQKEFETLREAAQNTALSDEVRGRKLEEAEDMLVTLRETEQRLREHNEHRTKQFQDQQRRMRRRIVEEISDLVVSYARRRGFSAVLDSSGQSLNALPLVMHADSRLDITDEVIAELNKGRE